MERPMMKLDSWVRAVRWADRLGPMPSGAGYEVWSESLQSWVPLHEQDRLRFYRDGLLVWMNPGREFYG